MWNPLRFYKESRKFTEGWSTWKFWTRLPKAFVIYYYLAFRYPQITKEWAEEITK